MEEDFDEFPRVQAEHDYKARSHKELSFSKGDIMIITDELNHDWFVGLAKNVTGCIPAAYVRHCKNWRELTMQNAMTMPKTKTSNLVPEPEPTRAQTINHLAPALPGLTKGPSVAGSVVQIPENVLAVGASDEELIAAKPIPRGPERPDLAKELQVRNQAAKVGGPSKMAPRNELAAHLHQLKAKQAQKHRWQDPAQSELQSALQKQSVRVEQTTREVNELEGMTELQRKIHLLKQKNNY
eukprot:m.263137 g.263137  ORF g.263137 m.263137 type:complete len:240 (+) comp16226_c2_seq33:246-965(+)